NPVTNFMTCPSSNLSPKPDDPNLCPGDAGHDQRVARSAFCPDGGGARHAIQIECCTRDAVARPGPEPEQEFVARYFQLTAANAPRFTLR
ncbi:MAG: hypothetical protein ABWY14_10540, partial [Tardiphaga sp.]